MPTVDRPLTTDAIRERAAQRIAEVGLATAADELGVGRESLLRLIAGVAIQRGTLALIREQLAKKGDI
jgi:hypothetical protein